jgi:hypothetical protein
MSGSLKLSVQHVQSTTRANQSGHPRTLARFDARPQRWHAQRDTIPVENQIRPTALTGRNANFDVHPKSGNMDPLPWR